MALSTDINLLVLADVKAFIEGSTTGTTTYDADYVEIINHVSGFFNSYCGRHLKAGDFTTYLDGQGSSDIQLDNFPVSSTGVAVNVDWSRTFSTDTQVSTSSIIVYRDEGRVALVNYYRGFGLGVQSIKVDYNAGYSSSDGIPFDLKHAALELAQFYWSRQSKKDRIGVRNESNEGMSRTYETDMPWSVKKILDYYATSRYY